MVTSTDPPRGYLLEKRDGHTESRPSWRAVVDTVATDCWEHHDNIKAEGFDAGLKSGIVWEQIRKANAEGMSHAWSLAVWMITDESGNPPDIDVARNLRETDRSKVRSETIAEIVADLRARAKEFEILGASVESQEAAEAATRTKLILSDFADKYEWGEHVKKNDNE